MRLSTGNTLNTNSIQSHSQSHSQQQQQQPPFMISPFQPNLFPPPGIGFMGGQGSPFHQTYTHSTVNYPMTPQPGPSHHSRHHPFTTPMTQYPPPTQRGL